ncbi:hypothetical protein GOBAR_AA05089 [Gossypium barbadense]|uniref:Uncharacterized protein n=1 Tax=Gossypium barbadense TaxID=3634 RepID=A0A2P5YIS0_GOSBA|nr:hypothetical protein GOBAR_AA05089 [Gossypium barbadense]
MSSSRGKKTTVPASKKRKEASFSVGPTAKIHHPFLQFPRGPQEELFQILWPRPLIVGRCIDWAAIEQVQMVDAIQALLTIDPCLHTEEFKEENKLNALSCHIHFSPLKCWHTLAPSTASYNPIRSKALVLPPSLRHVIDLVYFIALAIQHQTERHRKGVISIGPYVTRLARHFSFLNTAAQESSPTLICQYFHISLLVPPRESSSDEDV